MSTDKTPIEDVPDTGRMEIHFRLLFSEFGDVNDFVFEDISSGFERLMGLEREYFLQKKASEVYKTIIRSDFDWISYFMYYIKVAYSRRTEGAVRWIDIYGRYCRLVIVAEDAASVFIQDFPEMQPAADEIYSAPFSSKDMLIQRLQSIYDQHTAIILLISPDTGHIVDANPSACRFYGYSKEEILSLNINQINRLPPNEVRRAYTKAREKKENYFFFPHRQKSGGIRHVDVYSSPITDGNTTLLSSIIFDAAGRKKAKSKK